MLYTEELGVELLQLSRHLTRMRRLLEALEADAQAEFLSREVSSRSVNVYSFYKSLAARRAFMTLCENILQAGAFEGVVLDPPLRWDAEPLNSDCQINASLRRSSMSFSVQSLVGRAWRNIMTSWKSIFRNLSDHLTKKATQT